jgi:predicted Zn-dependent peptidase
MKPQVLTLANGIPLALMELPAMESVSIGVFVDIGARHDPAPLSGMAHFAEHLFFKGTKKRSARELSVATETLGGSADAFTSEEHTCFYMRGPAEDFAHYAEVLLDMFLNSTFPADEVEREREVISEEISMYFEQPPSRAEDLLCQTMWPKHPLGRSISGDEKSLRRISRQHLINHTKAHYGKKNIVLAVAGKITAAQVTSTLNKLFTGTMNPGKRPTHRPNPKSAFGRGPQITIETRAIEQTQLALGFHAPGRDQIGSAEVLKLLNVVAGENTSSRLWQEVREKRGWCYQIETDPTVLSDTGLFQVYAGVDPANADKALDLIWKELKKLADKPVPKAELERAISYTIGSNRLSLENTANYMQWIGEALLFHREVVDLATAHEKLRKVTAAQLQEFAASIFTPENMGLVVVGPEIDTDRLQDVIFDK